MTGFEIRELGPDETHLAREAMLELRPKAGGVEEFVERVNERQRPEGYRLVAAMPAGGGGGAVAVAGFRLMHNLIWGRFLYVDDLSTLPDARRQGLAGRLLTWMAEEAERLDCSSLQLDSAVGPTRADAHRLYFNHRLQIAAFHFIRVL